MDIGCISTHFWLFRCGKNEILIDLSFFMGKKKKEILHSDSTEEYGYFAKICYIYEIMLKIITSMSQLNLDQLMAVYVEGNRKNAEEFFPNLNTEEQMEMAERTFLDYLREDFFRQKGVFYAVWVEDGTYKAASRLGPYNDGYLIEALETAPDERRKGYASQLITEALSFLRTKNVGKVYSHVGKRNVASLAVHRKCGFKEVSDFAIYLDGTVTYYSCTLCCELSV